MTEHPHPPDEIPGAGVNAHGAKALLYYEDKGKRRHHVLPIDWIRRVGDHYEIVTEAEPKKPACITTRHLDDFQWQHQDATN